MRTWGRSKSGGFLIPQIEIFPHEGGVKDGLWIVIRITGLEVADSDSSIEMIRNCEASMRSIMKTEVETEIRKIGINLVSEAIIKSFVKMKDREKINALLKGIYADVRRNLTGIPYYGVKLRLWGWKKKTVPCLEGHAEAYIISVLDEYTLRPRSRFPVREI